MCKKRSQQTQDKPIGKVKRIFIYIGVGFLTALLVVGGIFLGITIGKKKPIIEPLPDPVEPEEPMGENDHVVDERLARIREMIRAMKEKLEKTKSEIEEEENEDEE